MDGCWRDPIKYQTDAIRVTIAIFVLALLVRYVDPGAKTQDMTACRILVDNAKRFYSVAQQDRNVNIRQQHAAMAVANIQTARQLYNDTFIERATGTDVHESFQKMETFLNKLETDAPTPKKQPSRTTTSSLPMRLPTYP